MCAPPARRWPRFRLRRAATAALYYQQVRGQSALFAGLLLAPQGVGMLLTRSKAGTLTDRLGQVR